MPSEIDICRSAQVLVKRYGEDAKKAEEFVNTKEAS